MKIVLAVLLSAAPLSAETFPNLSVSFGQAQTATRDYKTELFSRAWIKATTKTGASCAETVRGVKPLFTLPEDQRIVDDVVESASSQNLAVGPECRKLVLTRATADDNVVLLDRSEIAERPQNAPAAAQAKRHDPLYLGSLAFVAGTDAFDMKTTFAGIDAGGYEANPLMAALGNRNKGGVLAMNIGVSAAIGLFNHYFVYNKGHKKLAAVINFAQGGTHLAAGLHNRSLLK